MSSQTQNTARNRNRLTAAMAVGICVLLGSALAPSPVFAAHSHTCRNDCGVVTRISGAQKQKDSSGVGIVVGAVAGGVIGHEVSHGNDAGTVAGAVVGGVAGNEIEKNNNSTTYYKVTVRLDNGRTKTVKVGSRKGLTVGRRVRVNNGNIIRL